MPNANKDMKHHTEVSYLSLILKTLIQFMNEECAITLFFIVINILHSYLKVICFIIFVSVFNFTWSLFITL